MLLLLIAYCTISIWLNGYLSDDSFCLHLSVAEVLWLNLAYDNKRILHTLYLIKSLVMAAKIIRFPELCKLNYANCII